MPAQKERHIVDSKGKMIAVILRIGDYRKILRDLEEMESIRAYDAAKASGDEATSFKRAMEEIESSSK